ncbi:MAG: hypothetical protein AVDCRST_MAG64-1991 [uncultured Phycisphaerae bacterium]|uniref:Uncharacterized protein n=1 Tax=uncultured Phycisphaerae bacterium TaxID=904963 RepID=A0A6J4P530_9BACT|nr:MAG: hypothetical protein AVDCRST_MAG64-1991 [uncultured Phycisphaerae bacterium]
MLQTYEAILNGDRLEWSGGAPKPGRPVRVHVTVIDPTLDETPDERAARGKRMADALRELARSGAFKDITGPVAWQREIRKDRPLPGRED